MNLLVISIYQCRKQRYVKCPISGHEWPEEKLIDKWEVRRAGIPQGTCKTYEGCKRLIRGNMSYYKRLQIVINEENERNGLPRNEIVITGLKEGDSLYE